MVSLAEHHSSIGIVGAYRIKGAHVEGDRLPNNMTFLSGREACRRHLPDNIFRFGLPTSILFRSEVVRNRNPFYSEGRLNEDTEACYKILLDRDFGFIRQVLSYAKTENESMSSAVRNLSPYELDKWIIVKRYGNWSLEGDDLRLCQERAKTRTFACLDRVPSRFGDVGFGRITGRGWK